MGCEVSGRRSRSLSLVLEECGLPISIYYGLVHVELLRLVVLAASCTDDELCDARKTTPHPRAVQSTLVGCVCSIPLLKR